MSNIEIYKPPMLAIIEQETKLRDMPSEERLMKCTQIVANLLLDLGVGSKSDPQQHLRVIKFLADDCGKYTVKEVEYAFKLAIQGKLSVDLFQQINVLVVGKVLNAFDNYKTEKLRNFRAKKSLTNQKETSMTEDQIKIINNSIAKEALDLYLGQGIVNTDKIYVYAVLKKMGYISNDPEYMKSVKEDAVLILRNEYEGKKATSVDEKREFKNILKEINSEKGGKIINKCRELALYDFFRKITKDSEMLNEFKSKIKY
jgi:hypothetical protein